jgi:hypothetical protein
MPYQVKKYVSGWFVIKTTTNKKMSKKPFKTKELAIKQMQAIGINESKK